MLRDQVVHPLPLPANTTLQISTNVSTSMGLLPLQVFLTASATLREQVAMSFRRLQAAAPNAPPAGAAEAAAAELHTFARVPGAAFPLFLSTKKYLHMLDGTLPNPFFPRCVHLLVCSVCVLPAAFRTRCARTQRWTACFLTRLLSDAWPLLGCSEFCFRCLFHQAASSQLLAGRTPPHRSASLKWATSRVTAWRAVAH